MSDFVLFKAKDFFGKEKDKFIFVPRYFYDRALDEKKVLKIGRQDMTLLNTHINYLAI